MRLICNLNIFVIKYTRYLFLSVRYYLATKYYLVVVCSAALRNLVLSVQFKKREKQPWMSVTVSLSYRFYLTTLLKVTLLHG